MERVIPRLLLGDELKQALQTLPQYNPNIRSSPPAERMMFLSQLFDVFYPSPMACEIYSQLYFAYVNAVKKKLNYKASSQPPCGIIGGNDAFSIIGKSGIGKSTAIGRAISIISNSEILQINQSKVIPFLIIQTPCDSSIKGVLLEILRLVDDILSTRYYNDAIRSKATVDMLIGLVSKVCLNHVCVLILDESQNLLANKNGKNLVNAIVQLINTSGISVCFVGTPECTSFFESAFHLARRSIGLSYNGFDNDEHFEGFCYTLFKYQYTKNKTPLTQELINWLFSHSQGILAVAVGLVYSAQEIAIFQGSEHLNIEALKKAYDKRFGMLHIHLNHSEKSSYNHKKPVLESLQHPKKSISNHPDNFSLSNAINDSKRQGKDPLVNLGKHISIEVI